MRCQHSLSNKRNNLSHKSSSQASKNSRFQSWTVSSSKHHSCQSLFQNLLSCHKLHHRSKHHRCNKSLNQCCARQSRPTRSRTWTSTRTTWTQSTKNTSFSYKRTQPPKSRKSWNTSHTRLRKRKGSTQMKTSRMQSTTSCIKRRRRAASSRWSLSSITSLMSCTSNHWHKP